MRNERLCVLIQIRLLSFPDSKMLQKGQFPSKVDGGEVVNMFVSCQYQFCDIGTDGIDSGGEGCHEFVQLLAGAKEDSTELCLAEIIPSSTN